MTPNRPTSRWARTAARAAVVLGIAGLMQSGAPALASRSTPTGHSAALTLNLRDEGPLHVTKRGASLLLQEGPVSGTLPGDVHTHVLYHGGPIVTIQFTISTASGVIRGHGLGRLSNPRSASPSFVGPMAITGGSGSYANASGRGKLYGVFYLSNDNLIFQPVGQLHY
jgi:hypothetical protein